MMPAQLGATAPIMRPPRVLGAYQPKVALVESSHHRHMSPVVADQGNNSSCVGHAFANAIAIARRSVGRGKASSSADGNAIWRKGRAMYNGGSLDGGLTLRGGLHAAKALGLLDECDSQTVELSAEAISEAMRIGPLVVANSVHPGWDNLHPDNDAVDESQPFTPGTHGHATCAFAFDQHNGLWMVRMENSWGGRRGYVAMTIEHFIATALDEPILIRARS